MTVRDFDAFLQGLDPTARGADIPDGLIFGNPEAEVRAVATTWMASMEVLAKAVGGGVNLVITHEPTFWFHGTPRAPELFLCEQSGVDVSFKIRFLEEHGLAVLRAHNCWDRYPGYGIQDSLRERLGLPEPSETLCDFHTLYEVPPTTLRRLARDCRGKLGLPSVRVAGELDKQVQRVVLAYGSSSTVSYYHAFWKAGADAIISGEQSEWAEVRAALDMGMGVVELGHSNTEVFGMEGLARLLREHFPGVPIGHLPAGDTFQYV